MTDEEFDSLRIGDLVALAHDFYSGAHTAGECVRVIGTRGEVLVESNRICGCVIPVGARDIEFAAAADGLGT